MKPSVVPASNPELLKPRGLRVTEAAAYLGVTVNFIRDAVAKQKLPAMMLGHRLVLDRSDLDKFLERLKVKAAA